MLYSRFIIDSRVFQMMSNYYQDNLEVGGALFGEKSRFKIIIKAISFKVGNTDHISFISDDEKIFYPPTGMVFVGTWHTHIKGYPPNPSFTDIIQWGKWDQKFLHIIYTRKQVAVFNGRARKIGEYSIYSKEGKS